MDDDVDDAFLVRQAQEGHLDAFSELTARYAALAYRVALRITGDHHDAEDVAQESLVAAWQQLWRFRGESGFATWLYRIVTRRALNRVQRTPRQQPLAQSENEVGDEGADRQVERDLTQDAVTRAILALPPVQRVAVVLHHFEGLSYAEVAAVTGATVPAVRSHLFRARRTLGAALAEWR